MCWFQEAVHMEGLPGSSLHQENDAGMASSLGSAGS